MIKAVNPTHVKVISIFKVKFSHVSPIKFSFFQDRHTRVEEEQLWSVAIIIFIEFLLLLLAAFITECGL